MTKIRTNSGKQITHPRRRDRLERALAQRERELAGWSSNETTRIARLMNGCGTFTSEEDKIAKAEAEIANLKRKLGVA